MQLHHVQSTATGDRSIGSLSRDTAMPMRWQMFSNSSHTIVLVAALLGAAGIALLVQSRLQITMLRRRVASGAGTAAVDPATGLFAAAAAWQRIRGEANRAHRLQRPLHVWVGSAPSSDALDAAGARLAEQLPIGAMGVRVTAAHVCLVSCVDADPPTKLARDLEWNSCTIAPGDDAAAVALRFVAEVTGA
jgi:hypothetical protein